MHHEHPVGGETIHVPIRVFPFGCFLLWTELRVSKQQDSACVQEVLFIFYSKNILLINNFRCFSCQTTHPEEDIFGGIEAGGVNARGVGWVALADDSAGEA